MEQREQELTKILEALLNLRKNRDWQTLQELLHKPQVKNLESQLLVESLSQKMDITKLYRLQGAWEVAKLNDVERTVEMIENELKAIKSNNESS